LKFAHLADTHIRNLKYHQEYREVFNKIYDILREEKVDCIVHCGDLAHTKTQLSPEYFDLAQWFLKSLADIAPLYIIPGNHDGNLKNSNRQDAITPIVEALAHPNLHFLKKSGETHLNDKFSLNVLSIFDEENWVEPSDKDKVNIAIHHGSIHGCRTDQNWVMEFGDNDISIFDGHDYALLGDIHKTNQILDDDGRVRYCGSTVQQNHGETNDKGFLLWDIQDKENYAVRAISVPNPKPFMTIDLTPKGKLPRNLQVPENARLRIRANNNLPLNVIKKALDVARATLNPETTTFLNKAAGERGSVEELTKNFLKEDLRDVGIQEKFIKEYLKDYRPSEDVLEKVFEYNRKYNSIVEQEEEVQRNVNWNIVSMEWDNLFNYGEENKIDFENLNGIVGVFGKNYSGKSSIVDGLLYTLYNTTSKNNRKNLHVINQNKDFCNGKLKIAIGKKEYTIERRSEKYEKSLHGETTIEAKTDIEFNRHCKVTEDAESLNGLSRNDTDKNIRKVFGTIDDFLLTSMASQLDSLSFIKEGSTKRKEILAKFIDLVIFDKKFKMAKEETADLKAAVRRLEEKDFDEEISEVEEEMESNQKLTREQKKVCESVKQGLLSLEEEVKQIDLKINSMPAGVVNIESLRKDLQTKAGRMQDLIKENQSNEDKIKDNNAFLEKVVDFKSSFDITDLTEKRSIIAENKKKLDSIVNELNIKNNNLTNLNKKVKLLEEVPCGSEFSHCKFIKDAYVAQNDVNLVQDAIDRLNQNSEKIEGEIVKLDPNKIEDYIEKYNQIVGKEAEKTTEVSDLSLHVEKNNSQIITVQLEVDKLNEKVLEYEKNREVIENLELLVNSKKDIKKNIKKKKDTLQNCEESMLELYKSNGSLEQRLENLKGQQEELRQLREDISAYDLFMRCMHPNGIPYDIIKKKLPIINEEIAKILTNIVNFEVFFEANDKKLEIYIKHPRFDARPIELGSGAEKTISAMAIRLALLGVSNLPKPDMFILDEPGTALDEENMEGFIRILTDMIKTQFKTVLLISHLDSLKDCVDTTIEIDRKDGYAYISQ